MTGTGERSKRRLLFAAALSAVVMLGTISPQGAAEARDAYQVEAETIAVADTGQGSPPTVGMIAYTAPGDSERPVLFAFNGGPGASSTFLHLGVLGPYTIEVPSDPAAPLPAAAKRVRNDGNLLDVVDIVFIDPPGTGLSSRGDADPAVYNGVQADADAVAEAVALWLKSHDRTDAPVYILGESYGTIRAVAMLGAFAELETKPDLRGVVLLGQALNMVETSQRPDNVISYVVSLPTLAAIACYHGRIAAPCVPADLADEAAQFARGAYLDALFAGHRITPDEKARVAARLEALSGLSAQFYLDHDLRVSKEQFRVELLRGDRQVVGRYDARYTAPLPDDAGNMVGPDAFSAVSGLYAEAMPPYLADVGVAADPGQYKVVSAPAGDWPYGGTDSPFSDWPFMAMFERAAAANPCLRLFVGTGLFDLTTTVGAADYLLAQSSLEPGRYRSETYRAGHMFYSDPTARDRLLGDLRGFMKQDSCT